MGLGGNMNNLIIGLLLGSAVTNLVWYLLHRYKMRLIGELLMGIANGEYAVHDLKDFVEEEEE